MQPESYKPLPHRRTMKEEKPDSQTTRPEERGLSESQKNRFRAARYVLEIVRRRFHESKEKFRLRKQLRAERNKNRKIQRERAKKLGKQVMKELQERRES